jgi:hypothetical protein
MSKRAYVTKLTPAERRKRARKAARVAVKNRLKGLSERDQGIALAYRYFSSQTTKEESIKALRFLTKCGHGTNLPEDTSVRNFLALATGLTKRRISQILARELDRFPWKH